LSHPPSFLKSFRPRPGRVFFYQTFTPNPPSSYKSNAALGVSRHLSFGALGNSHSTSRGGTLQHAAAAASFSTTPPGSPRAKLLSTQGFYRRHLCGHNTSHKLCARGDSTTRALLRQQLLHPPSYNSSTARLLSGGTTQQAPPVCSSTTSGGQPP